MVGVGVSSWEADEGLIEEDACYNHQCSDSVCSPTDKEMRERGRVMKGKGVEGRGWKDGKERGRGLGCTNTQKMCVCVCVDGCGCACPALTHSVPLINLSTALDNHAHLHNCLI